MKELIHQWGIGDPGDHAINKPSGGHVFELEPGQYQVISDLHFAVFKIAENQPDAKVTLTSDGRFAVTALAMFRIDYPVGGKGHTQLNLVKG